MIYLAVFLLWIGGFLMGYAYGNHKAFTDIQEVLEKLKLRVDNTQDLPYNKDALADYLEQEFDNKREN